MCQSKVSDGQAYRKKIKCGNTEITTTARSKAVSSLKHKDIKDELVINTDETQFTVGKVDDVYWAKSPIFAVQCFFPLSANRLFAVRRLMP